MEYYGEAAHRDRVNADAVRVLELRQRHHEVLVLTKGMRADARGLAAFVHGLRRDREEDFRRGRLPWPDPPIDRPRLTPLRTRPLI